MVEKTKKVWKPKFKYEYILYTSKRIKSPMDLVSGDITYLLLREKEIK